MKTLGIIGAIILALVIIAAAVCFAVLVIFPEIIKND